MRRTMPEGFAHLAHRVIWRTISLCRPPNIQIWFELVVADRQKNKYEGIYGLSWLLPTANKIWFELVVADRQQNTYESIGQTVGG